MSATFAGRRVPSGAPAAIVAGLAALALLGLQLQADPAAGVTVSGSPFTDEGFQVLGARNLVLLGTWARDEWPLPWVELPFTITVGGAFELLGVGILQARLVSVACSVIGAALLAAILARRVGEAAGMVAGVGLATSSLFLFYGRLALLEPMVLMFLIAGLACLLGGRTDRWLLPGAAAGVALGLAAGTKASAIIAVGGLLAGAFVVGWTGHAPLRRRVAVATVAIGAAGAAWAVVVVPQPGVFDTIRGMWPDQRLPASLTEAWHRMVDYLGASDGAIPGAAPLIVGSVAGLLASALGWRRLDPAQRALVGASVGWILLGIGILLIVPYRPSRYVVPMLPPMAILTAVGAARALAWMGNRSVRERSQAAAALVASAMMVALAFPGIRDLAAWTGRVTHDLPAIQAEVTELVTNERAIEGQFAPTVAMRIAVPLIVPSFGVNEGDSYDDHDVRWLIAVRHAAPRWADAHPAAWSARETVDCFAWPPDEELCLVRVP